IIGKHKSVIEFFLSKGVSVNDTDRYGNTLLHHVVDSGKKLFDDGKKLEIVRLLIDKGANIYARNNNGRIPSDLARERGHMEIVNILGSAENKSQLSKTTRGTDGKPEPYLSGITISNQPMRTRAPGN
ncbi:ankyrin repeat domain-containing protein, partial [Wolbachia pipientis]|uniref:ankyrin repeat domain-containing protein n=1 Tax=Wolbachia pipientis TaxID=955 RepID=UPI0032D567E7|nr:hypothetical protein [Wolbachia pipientis]